jgi:hypothetical protein
MDKATNFTIYLNSLKKKKKTDSSAKPQTVNRVGKGDVIKPQTVNRVGKGDVIKPQTVNRTGKMDKATYLNFLKKKKKVGVEEGLTSAYEYGKAKIKQAYEAASRPTGTSALIPTKAKAAGTPTKPYERMRTKVVGRPAYETAGLYPAAKKTVNTVRPETPGSYPKAKKTRSSVGGPGAARALEDRPSVAAAAATAASAVNNKGAAPKGTTPTKRYKNARERRMAERYAIGTSGRPL